MPQGCFFHAFFACEAFFRKPFVKRLTAKKALPKAVFPHNAKLKKCLFFVSLLGIVPRLLQQQKALLSQKGQSAEEVIGIVMVILIFFMFVLLASLQKNSETEMIAKIAENEIECNSLSETISNFFNNRAKSEQVLFIKKAVAIKPNVIFVDDNSISCTYNGIARDSSDLDEFSLNAFQQYRFWKGNGKVIVCAMPC